MVNKDLPFLSEVRADFCFSTDDCGGDEGAHALLPAASMLNSKGFTGTTGA